MTPDEINEAIAKSLGWKPRVIFIKDGLGNFDVPNYHSDLNACAEFEQRLSREANIRNWTEAGEYVDKLGDVLCLGNVRLITEFDKITATAAQRCESYLKLKGLWCDS
jgi:hypothetical protein